MIGSMTVVITNPRLPYICANFTNATSTLMLGTHHWFTAGFRGSPGLQVLHQSFNFVGLACSCARVTLLSRSYWSYAAKSGGSIWKVPANVRYCTTYAPLSCFS
jgi:hypothetical protein